MPFEIKYPGQSPISKEGFRPTVLQSMVATRRPFEDPNSLASQVLGISSQKYSPKGRMAQVSSPLISGGCNHSNQWSRNQALKHFLDNSIGPYRLYSHNIYGIGPFGTIHIPLWEYKTQSQLLKMAGSALTQKIQ
ncbi:hypothetical protein O181_099130 [Austropuccinia psidii MF-1]|uniref:Uncharacterized protein n=1 Tax=Austropuccinia psidii MF-1 TaxID=1389203 RepID=A0A9Q3PFL6_9BASI|nr:hypothetical protein [Austropuccinia psidii MF-1]